MSDCYLIYHRDGSGRFPMYRTDGDKIAVMLFKSRESAQRFIDWKDMSSEWTVVQKPQVDTVQWLRDCVMHNGASEIAIDPDPKTSSAAGSTPSIPIVALLMEWEGRNG